VLRHRVISGDSFQEKDMCLKNRKYSHFLMIWCIFKVDHPLSSYQNGVYCKHLGKKCLYVVFLMLMLWFMILSISETA